ncbi:3267_t:CDS:2 [Rhizophagus irregularis]|nr:3267_t:CDS:2 [Rhizophagus irregularis]
MSYFPRADDFAPRLGYDHTLTGPEDFIFNHDTIQRVSPTEDTLSDTLSPSYDLEDFSSRPKVKKRQEARFNASMRKTFHNAKLTPDAPMDDKLQAARHHKFLFQENQHFSTPIKHLRYKKKFIVPKQDDYTFPLPFPETNTNLMVAMSDLNPIDSSVVSTLTGNSTPPSSIIDTFENVPAHYVLLIPEEPFYKGGLLNQPSRSKIRKRNLNPLTVGSNAWLAHMKEIYDQHEEDMKYEREKTDAGIRWDTTPD